MTIRAYPEIHLNKAQTALGTAFDYAVNACKIDGGDFAKMLAASSTGKRLENGEPAVLSGKSGVETACDIIYEATGKKEDGIQNESFSRSPEYWIGWAAAYYQWYSDRSYYEIFTAVSYGDFEKMYYTLHEADISKFVDTVDSIIKTKLPETNLKRLRLSYGITQAELAKQAGVSLRSIQMYEQRKKDINKASFETVYGISKVLGCSVEELFEK